MANTARNKPGVEKITVEDNNRSIEQLQSTYESNKKGINTAVTVVLLAIVGFFGYQRLYKAPRETKAASAMAFPQRYFQADSMNKALNGDGQHMGFLKIMKKFSGTDAANLSNYYAGIAYLQMNDPKAAIKHLEDFDGGSTKVQYAAYGALGDAYMESGNISKGIENYNKAAGNKEDNLLTPLYLYRAGAAYELNKQNDKAKDAYKRIRDEYPQSMQAREMDKLLARLGEVN